MENLQEKIERVRGLLEELIELLNRENEQNWIRGVNAAYRKVVEIDAPLDEKDFDNARSVFLSMTAGGRGFSEYYISSEDQNEQIRRNIPLDNLRKKLWEEFTN
jgi:hypothetical protein